MVLTNKRLVLGLVTLLGAALLLGACGGGSDDENTPTAERPASTATAAEEETPAASEETIDVDQTFWHAGWKVTLGEATFSGEGTSRSVAIEAEFENLGDDESTFDSQLVLTAGGNNYTESTFDQDLPRVPGKLKGKGLITFSVDEEFTFDDATLTVGNSSNNQATVPVGPEGEELVDLAPVEVALTGTATAGAVTLNVTGVEIRADLPEKHDEVEKGKKALIVSFSATVGSGIAIGQGVLQSENVVLKLPDGTAVAVRTDGVSGVNELLQGKEGTTIPDLSVRFEIPEPVDGAYAFVVRGKYGAGGEQAEGELAFTVSVAGAATPAVSGTGTPKAAGTATAAAGTPTP